MQQYQQRKSKQNQNCDVIVLIHLYKFISFVLIQINVASYICMYLRYTPRYTKQDFVYLLTLN